MGILTRENETTMGLSPVIYVVGRPDVIVYDHLMYVKMFVSRRNENEQWEYEVEGTAWSLNLH